MGGLLDFSSERIDALRANQPHAVLLEQWLDMLAHFSGLLGRLLIN